MSIRWIALNVRRPVSDLATSVQQLKMADRGRILTILMRDHQRMYYPIDVANERTGCLEFSQPLTDVKRYTLGTIYQTSTLILGMLVCGGAVALLGIRLVGQRLEKLIEKTRQIGQGDFSQPLQLRGNDKLNQLATALNEMSQQLADQQEKIRAASVARLAAVEQLRHVDRLKTVGRLASGVAHELGTALNVVSGRAELIASRRLDEEQSRESALAIKSEADRMANIIRQLLDFGRRGTPERTSVDLRHVANQCVELLRSFATKDNVELIVSGNASLTANVDAAQIQQVVTNLVVNAIQAMPDGGTVSIDVQQRRARPPGVTNANEETYCLPGYPKRRRPFLSAAKAAPARNLSPDPSTAAVHERTDPLSPLTAPHCPKRCWKANYSVTRKARSPTREPTARGFSRGPRAARCSSMKSATCHSPSSQTSPCSRGKHRAPRGQR